MALLTSKVATMENAAMWERRRSSCSSRDYLVTASAGMSIGARRLDAVIEVGESAFAKM
jgi:hypothetical protein